MKLFKFVVIFLILFLAFCTKPKNDTGVSTRNVTESDTVLAALSFNTGLFPASPFRIDSVIVVEKAHLRFINSTDYNATFVVPNSNKLFNNNKAIPHLQIQYQMSNIYSSL